MSPVTMTLFAANGARRLCARRNTSRLVAVNKDAPIYLVGARLSRDDDDDDGE